MGRRRSRRSRPVAALAVPEGIPETETAADPTRRRDTPGRRASRYQAPALKRERWVVDLRVGWLRSLLRAEKATNEVHRQPGTLGVDGNKVVIAQTIQECAS